MAPEAEPRTQVLLVRHGETAWNVTGTLQGQQDVHLNEKGRLQAQLVAARLARDHGPAAARAVAVCSSDLSRALETAQLVTAALVEKTNGKILIDARLREFNSGIFTGGTLADAKRDHALAWQRYVTDDAFVVPEGESVDLFTARVLQAFDELTMKHHVASPGCALVIVTHGGVIDIIKQHRLRPGSEAPALRKAHNASLGVLEMETSSEQPSRCVYRVLLWNDTVHLAELDSKKGADDDAR